MTDLNYTVFTGRLTSDISIKPAGKSNIMTGSFAVNRSVKDGDTWKDVASFFNFQKWVTEKQIDYYKNSLKKTTPIILDGQWEQQNWEKDGQKHSRLVIIVNNIKAAVVDKNNKNQYFSDFPADILKV